MTSGVLLAGGASRRFPPNKLAIDFDGVPLLWHSLRTLAAVSDEVVLVLGHDMPGPALPALSVPLAVTRDAIPDSGPLVALEAGLARAQRDWALVVAGDMPWISARLLAAIAARAQASRADVVALEADDGPRPLPCAVRVAAIAPLARTLVASGERRLRAVLERGRIDLAPAAWWRRLDPEGSWLRDVDTPNDLARGP